MDIKEEIIKLKKEKDVVILAHYYVDGAIQEVADFVGDSYYLSKAASSVPQKTILFCGVHFMGESAKILNPEKTVIMADNLADCPMAHMTDAAKIKKTKSEYDDLAVVCYINSTAEIKAHSDVCVTSSNALKIVSKLPQKNILFIPDNNLGSYIAKQLPEKNFIYHDGHCIVHHAIKREELIAAKAAHPNALVLVHPECTADIVALADYVGSTSGIIEFAKKSDAKEFIIGTEVGVFYNLEKENPDKRFYPINSIQICRNMKLINIDKVLYRLQTLEPELKLKENIRLKAEIPLKRMHELAE